MAENKSVNPLLHLLVPNTLAEQNIKARIEWGRKIIAQSLSVEGPRIAMQEAIKWFEDTNSLFSRLFDNIPLLGEYGSFFYEIQTTKVPSDQDYGEFFRRRMNALISELDVNNQDIVCARVLTTSCAL